MSDDAVNPKRRRLTSPDKGGAERGASGKEFQILQGYRNFEDDVAHDRATVARTGDISVAVQRLEEVNMLFKQAGDLNLSVNSLFAQDSHAVMSVSELASLSIRNLKLTNAGKLLSPEEFVNGAKRFLLEDYLELNHVSVPGSMYPETDDASNTQNDSIENDGDATSDALDESTNQHADAALRQSMQRNSYLRQFEAYGDFAQFNWFKMGALFQQLGGAPTLVDHMLGPLAVQKKTRVATQRRAVENVGAKTTAEAVTRETLNSNQSETTPEQVKKCFQVLIQKNGYNSISLFRFIIDPSSYARSIENLFYTSFLIKEGRLVLEDDDEGFPAIRPKEPLPQDPAEKELERQRRNDARQKHIIFQMDMATWRKLIDKFHITESFLP
ncbi:AFL198Wp [Eremothecium gossypii ATCC 10895]|uniref:Non-structural maintenance of chromosomes element 4 n=1 Tax=Eremothecium gossypii (strain ATCC 10895 / CBS 109.51 / FGSC 9923 / NRRL Y-1056) TaxID=284811 RepID=Q755L2_EREGS|nr:AFL198Wp [Eremothecium gossypii ATCC 10895]AAS53176.1 AFL198Wp [Eremothecium gossypii ATCC 10895]AEY97486.1 FAFL198Wp [Eremothecium gossypii FDAG1]